MRTEPLTPRRAPTGFTLVELVVVLAILATLAATAVLSTEGLVDQSRYDATRGTLGDVEDAILGQPALVTPQGQPWVQGFVADVGRLPQASGSLDPELASQLASELWTAPLLEPFSIQTPAGDHEVRVACGWRGPYVRLPLGTDGLLDSWGRPLELVTDAGLAVQIGEEIAGFSTLGADGLSGGIDHDEDLAVLIDSVGPPLVGPRHLGAVPLRVNVANVTPGTHVVARLYGPVSGAAATLQQLDLEAAASLSFGFVDVPIGARALRVYLTSTDPDTIDEEDPFCVLGETDPNCVPVLQSSDILPLVVVAGGVPEIVVDLD